MSSLNTKYPLEILIDQGQRLSELLKNIKHKHKDNTPESPSHSSNEVKDIVSKVLNGLETAPPEAGLTKESIPKLVKKIESILEEFVKHDSDYKSVYEELAEEVRRFNSQKQQGSDSDLVAETSVDSAAVESSVETVIDLNESEYGNISANEQKYLSCFLLFPAGAEIKKRDIIHCWLGVCGINYVHACQWIPLLAKFVKMGLIERTSKNKKLLNRYKMTKRVHNSLSKQLENPTHQNEDGELRRIRITEKELSYTLLHQKQIVGSYSPYAFELPVSKVTGRDVGEKVDAFALLNVSQTTLTTAWLKKVCQMETLGILFLGSWRQEPEKYIVIEDVDAFKHLEVFRSRIHFLSLGGVTGMVKLPESVYKINFLVVLDLRGCNNLENIPRGIKSLKHLTHLDLTGCYLLDHLPLEICTLERLIVLKGFVVTEDDMSEKEKIKQVNNGKEKRRRGKARRATSVPCPFHELSKLQYLSKLTIHTRKTTFPTSDDFETIYKLWQLKCLRITWAKNSDTESSSKPDEEEVGRVSFPPKLTKLELQAATHHTASRILV